MKHTLFFTSLLLSLSSLSQTAIIDTDFTVAGDTIGISTSNDFSIDFATSGPGATWDFSALTEDSQLFEITHSISSGGIVIGLQFGDFAPPKYKASYFQAFDGLPLDQIGNFLPVNIESINRLTKIENDKATYLGYSLKVDGQQVGFRSDTIETAYVFPLQYGDSYTSRGYTKMDFNPIYDGLLIQYRQRESNVDGEGQLITTYGTYDVIRIHHKINETDSIKINFGGSPIWLPINRTLHEYEWWDNDLKRPVLKIETETVQGNETPTRITFLNNQIVGLEQNEIDIAIYPNPTNDYLTLNATEPIESVKIFSIDGKLVFSQPIGSLNTKLNLTNLSPGMYNLHSITKNGQSFNSIIIN